MTVVIDEHDVTVHLGDVRTVLAELPAGSVQCIVTSPPYYGLRDYGADGQIGLEASPAEYVAEMVAVFREARRVLAADGVLWLNLGDSYSSAAGGAPTSGNVATNGGERYRRPRVQDFVPPKNLLGMPWRVAFGLQDDGWILRNAVIWNKPNAMPESVTDRLACRYEHVFLFSKSRRYLFDIDAIKVETTLRAAGNTEANRQGQASAIGHEFSGGRRAGGNPGSTLLDVHERRNPGDVWSIPTSPFPGAHFACMPPELARRCILAGTPNNGPVLDPFAGSGTTLKVARSLGRKSVGIELNPDYVDIIRDRIGPTPFDFEGASA